jgi:two-component system nitrogen regulation response regulator NtrX
MGDILIVDDESDIRELISDILQDEGFENRIAGTAEDCMKEVDAAPPGLLILDLWLKDRDLDGIDILKKVKKNYPHVPVVIISGHGNIEIAVAAIKQGAYDFIEKPFNINQLLVVIRRAMEASQLRRENLALRSKEEPPSDMIGQSAGFKTLLSNLDKVTKSNARVLLTGASGSGKEVAARYIHAHSDRAHGPFVIVNSASIAPDQMENLLFGSESTKPQEGEGLFAQANGGSIYFDEIADMHLETQSKILRVLVDQQFQRPGSHDLVKLEMRVISSTSRDLPAAIEQKSFREELYHRLNVVPISVPALSERREDIPLLAKFFLEQFHQIQAYPQRTLSDQAAAMLQAMEWPGNIRELKNLLERILILSEGQGEITSDDLPTDTASQAAGASGPVLQGLASLPLRDAREAFEREYLMVQIERFGGNISKTAQFVGMERSALHRKLKSLSIVSGVKQLD